MPSRARPTPDVVKILVITAAWGSRAGRGHLVAKNEAHMLAAVA